MKHSNRQFYAMLIKAATMALILGFFLGMAGKLMSQAVAAELWLGANLTHLSQLDAGYPFNDNLEDSVDHIGLSAEIRGDIGNGFYWYIEGSAGQNKVLTDCACTWNDGGAEIDTKIEFGLKFKALEF